MDFVIRFFFFVHFSVSYLYIYATPCACIRVFLIALYITVGGGGDGAPARRCARGCSIRRHRHRRQPPRATVAYSAYPAAGSRHSRRRRRRPFCLRSTPPFGRQSRPFRFPSHRAIWPPARPSSGTPLLLPPPPHAAASRRRRLQGTSGRDVTARRINTLPRGSIIPSCVYGCVYRAYATTFVFFSHQIYGYLVFLVQC